MADNQKHIIGQTVHVIRLTVFENAVCVSLLLPHSADLSFCARTGDPCFPFRPDLTIRGSALILRAAFTGNDIDPAAKVDAFPPNELFLVISVFRSCV